MTNSLGLVVNLLRLISILHSLPVKTAAGMAIAGALGLIYPEAGILGSGLLAAGRADEKGLSLVVGTQQRYAPQYLELIQRLRDGQIGQLTHLEALWIDANGRMRVLDRELADPGSDPGDDLPQVDRSRKGLLLTDHKAMLVSARPIQRIDGSSAVGAVDSGSRDQGADGT